MQTTDNVSPIFRWTEELRPLRVLLVQEESALERQGEPSSAVDALVATLEQPALVDEASWSTTLPPEYRPTIDRITVEELLEGPSDVTYDLALCVGPLDDVPVGMGATIMRLLRQRARFVITHMRAYQWKHRWSGDPSAWRVQDMQQFCMLDRESTADGALVLLRGGGDFRPRVDHGVIHYLAPNREIYGGVKILYNHVAILNSLGIDAVLTVREPENFPASWFAWNPRCLVFDADAPRRVTRRDTIVIPEFRFREVRKYPHVARRILFAQNPGFRFDIPRWREMGFDGVLTLNCPDGSQSRLHAWLADRTDMPIFPISNHYSDDAWGKTSAERVAGRILCLPRKGPEFVERLKREFDHVVTVDRVSQSRMAYELARADIYVHTGFPEGQPMPPIEAMLSGCVVCGFTGQGGLDVMRDGQTAYVASDGNADELVDSVRRALTDPSREEVRSAGHELCQSFTRAVTARELWQCYTSWIEKLPRRRRKLAPFRALNWRVA